MFKRGKKKLNDYFALESEEATVIAVGTSAQGTIVSDNEVHILGNFTGRVDAKICVVGPVGIVEGEIDAEEILVFGEVIGPLRAFHVSLDAGAYVDGNVVSATIEVDNRARLNGSVLRTIDPFGAAAAAKPVEFLQAGPGEQETYEVEPEWPGSAVDNFRPTPPTRAR